MNRKGQLFRRLALMALVCAVVIVQGVFAAPAMARDALQAFSLAVRANDLKFLNRMPDLGLNENSRDDLRNNLLMIAIRDEGESFALALLNQKAWQAPDVLSYENQLGETALMIAALKGSNRVARKLIDLGAAVNRAGWTAMHYAATSGHTEMIRLLAEHNGLVDATSPNGTTPLMMAARFNHRWAAHALIDVGADPTMTNQVGLTARDYAMENNNRDMAFWLELQEIAFTSKYLQRLSDVNADMTLQELVQQSGGEVVTITPNDSGPREPLEATPTEGVEVFQGVQ